MRVQEKENPHPLLIQEGWPRQRSGRGGQESSHSSLVTTPPRFARHPSCIRRGWGFSLLLCSLLILPRTTTLAQEPQTPFRLQVETRLVVQTVSVKDRNGNLIEGLTAE